MDPSKTSIIDIKIGTSTVTDQVSKDADKLKKIIKLDQETTSAKLGYRIIGYSIKREGEPDQEMVKVPQKSVEDTESIIQNFF